jgi:monoterpene epsilon-lactone hydrolase
MQRADLVRLGLRLLVGRSARPRLTRQAVRRRLERLNRIAPQPPREIAYIATDAGGVKAERVVGAVSRPDRHVLYLHGGGYTYGSPRLYRDFTWRIAAAARATVLCVGYRLAPEHPFPAALDDAMAAYGWLIAQGAEPRHIAIAGDSAGGGLALALLLRLRDEGVPLPAAAAVISPWTDLALTGESLKRSTTKDPIVSIEAAAHSARLYLADADPRHPYASPLYGNLAGLPPTIILVGSDELLLDDAVGMAERMRAAGCEVELDVAPGMFHGWHLFSRLMRESRVTIAKIGTFLQRTME